MTCPLYTAQSFGVLVTGAVCAGAVHCVVGVLACLVNIQVCAMRRRTAPAIGEAVSFLEKEEGNNWKLKIQSY